ncbi:MAG: DnaB-like helicase C-terminal domain-containing protein [Vibrio cyclitrophicus]
MDYLQHISHKLNYNAPQTYIVGDMTTKLKHLATELGIAIVIVCQLNRDVGKGNKGDHLPKLRHLKDSGSIEQDSDVVLLLHREDLIDPETSQRNIMDVLISKNRQGKTGASKLFYEKPIFSLRDLEE